MNINERAGHALKVIQQTSIDWALICVLEEGVAWLVTWSRRNANRQYNEASCTQTDRQTDGRTDGQRERESGEGLTWGASGWVSEWVVNLLAFRTCVCRWDNRSRRQLGHVGPRDMTGSTSSHYVPRLYAVYRHRCTEASQTRDYIDRLI